MTSVFLYVYPSTPGLETPLLKGEYTSKNGIGFKDW